MGDQIKNMLVGLLMIAACAFTISLILFLKPSVGDGKHIYCARFSNINGIGIGTRVLFAGKPVGEVVSIHEVVEARKMHSDETGRVYFYQLKLRVDSSITIFNTDKVGIQTSGLLGEKSIAITPESPPPGVTPKPVPRNQPIYAESTDPIEKAFSELSALANEMEGTFNYLNGWLDRNGDEMGAAVAAFRKTMDGAAQVLDDVNQQKVISSAKQAICNFSLAMDRIQGSVKVLQEGQFFENANIAMDGIDSIIQDIARGKGTLGKLIVEDDMYLSFNSVLSKVSTLMNDINNYGILFHMNKTWKRQRLQRVSLMDSLDSPQSFQVFFQQEIDDINTAMERLSMVIEKADNSQNRQKIFQDKRFTKDFAELFREVSQLSDNLKLYNEQLVEAQNNDATGS